jgi:hypothetical protein
LKIKLIKGWNGLSKGAILEPELAEVSDTLIRRGIAEEVKEVKNKPHQKIRIKDDPVF